MYKKRQVISLACYICPRLYGKKKSTLYFAFSEFIVC